jgi:hypothetical protein
VSERLYMLCDVRVEGEKTERGVEGRKRHEK